MPATPVAVSPVAGEQAAALDRVTSDRDASNAQARLPRRAATAKTRGNRWQHALNGVRHIFETSYDDPRFQRPDAVEDDYYRFRNQPRG
jgi:hypothetical protein